MVVRQKLGNNFAVELEDLTQEVVQRFCTHPPVAAVAHPKAYFATCARNRVNDFFVAREAPTHGDIHKVPLEGQPPGSVPEDWAPSREDEIVFKHLVGDLQVYMEATCSAEQFSVWKLDFDPRAGCLTYLTNVEIAAELGTAMGNVARWRSSARKIALAFIQNYDTDAGGAA
jgi:DNA-directed RNA polymerase specialized sigma24 family protein